MHISISSAGEVRVTGLSDEEYRLAGYVEELDRFLGSLSNDSDEEYRLAGYVEELDRFLNKVSNGNVTVDDL